MNANAYKENLIKISNWLENCNAIHEEKERKLQECNDYYDCVSENFPYLEKYHKISAEISDNFDRQHFDTYKLSNSFTQIGILDDKLTILQSKISDIQKFLRPNAENIVALPYRCYDDLSFGEVSSKITEIDNIIYDLQQEKAKAEERRCKRIKNWKAAGKVIWTILKWTLIVGGFIFVIIWTIIKTLLSGSRDDD